jgi:hypothetical protein
MRLFMQNSEAEEVLATKAVLTAAVAVAKFTSYLELVVAKPSFITIIFIVTFISNYYIQKFVVPPAWPSAFVTDRKLEN